LGAGLFCVDMRDVGEGERLHTWLSCRGAVRISVPVAVKIGKLEWNRLRRLPAFKGERAAPPPIFAPEQGGGVQPPAQQLREAQRKPGSSGGLEPDFWVCGRKGRALGSELWGGYGCKECLTLDCEQLGAILRQASTYL